MKNENYNGHKKIWHTCMGGVEMMMRLLLTSVAAALLSHHHSQHRY